MRTLHKPEAGQRVLVADDQVRSIALAFNMHDASPSRDGNNLVLTFADGAQVVFINYFLDQDGNWPQLAFADGLMALAPDDIRNEAEPRTDTARPAAQGEETADDEADAGVDAVAPPAEEQPSRAEPAPQDAQASDSTGSHSDSAAPQMLAEGKFHIWDSMSLLPGSPHLGPLDINWGGNLYADFMGKSGDRWDDAPTGLPAPAPREPEAPVNHTPVLGFAAGGEVLRTSSHNTASHGQLTVFDPDPDGALGATTGGKANQTFSVTDGKGHEGVAQADGSVVVTTDHGTLTIRPDGSYTYEVATEMAGGVPNVKGMTGNTKLEETFTITVTDLHGAQSAAELVVHVHNGNDAPEVAGPPVHVLEVAEAGLVPGGNTAKAGTPTATGSFTVTDADGDTPTFSAGGTVADGVDTRAGTYGSLQINTTTGAYTYVLDNTKAATQALKPGDNPKDSFTITISDGHGGSITRTVDVNVAGANDTPVLTLVGNSSFNLKDSKGADGKGTGAFSVADPDSDGAWTTGVTNANHKYLISAGDGTSGTATNGDPGQSSTFKSEYGTLTVKPDGTYSYVVNTTSEKVLALGNGKPHTDQFVITVVDKHEGASQQTVNVTVLGKSDAPRFGGDTNAGGLTAKGVLPSSNTDTPGTDESSGKLKVSHTDSDASGGIAFNLSTSIGGAAAPIKDPDTGIVSLKTKYGTLFITPKELGDGSYECAYRFELDNNSQDVKNIAGGATVPANFKVLATDSSGTRPLDLNFLITGSNDRAVISSPATAPEQAVEDATGTEKSVVAGQVVATDPDAGDKLSYTLVNPQTGATPQILLGQYGRLEIIQDSGKYTYYLDNAKAQSLAEGQTGYDEFTVRVKDKLGAYVQQVVKIPIAGKDDAPVLGSLKANVQEDNGAADAVLTDAAVPVQTGTVTATDKDALDSQKSFELLQAVDNAAATVSHNDSTYKVQGKYGLLEFHADGSYTYTLNRNDSSEIQQLNVENSLTDSFAISVTTGHPASDGVTASSSTTTGNLLITIKGSNDNPVVTAHDNLLVNQGNVISTGPIQGQLQITDVDDAVTQAGNNIVTSTNHKFYFLDEGNKVQSMTGKFGVLVVNQHTGQYTYTLDQYAQGLAAGGQEKFEIVVEDAHKGTARQEITVDLGALTSTPSEGGEIYTLTGTDLAVTEDAFNPATTNVQAGATATSSSVTGPFGFVGAAGRFSQTVAGTYGTITINDAGQYTYVLNNDMAVVQALPEGKSITESFQLWGSGSSTVKVTVTGANDQPKVQVSNEALSLTQKDGQESSAGGTARAEDVDTGNAAHSIPGDTHTFWLDAAGTKTQEFYKLPGSTTDDYKVEINSATGAYTLTYLSTGKHLTKDDTANVSFEVYTRDSSGAANSASAPVTINATINGTNAVPVWGAAPVQTVAEDEALTGNITRTGVFLTEGTVTDDTGNTQSSGLSFSILSGGSPTSLLTANYGTLQITDARTGAYTFTLNNQHADVQKLALGESMTQDFTIRVTDKHGGSADKTFTVTINGANDAPTLNSLTGINFTAKANSTALTDSALYQAVGKDTDTSDTLTYGHDAGSFKVLNNAGHDITGGRSLADFGIFHMDSATGKYHFELDNSKEAVRELTETQTVTLHFNVSVSDGHETVVKDLAIQVSGVNDSPVLMDASGATPLGASLPETWDIASGIPHTGQVSATDPEHAPLTFRVDNEGKGHYGDLSIDNTGHYTYTLHDGVSAGDIPPDFKETFTITVDDGKPIALNPTDSVQLELTLTGGTQPPPAPSPAPSPFSLTADDSAADAPSTGTLAALLDSGESLDSLLGDRAAPLPPPTQDAAAATLAAANTLPDMSLFTADTPVLMTDVAPQNLEEAAQRMRLECESH